MKNQVMNSGKMASETESNFHDQSTARVQGISVMFQTMASMTQENYFDTRTMNTSLVSGNGELRISGLWF